MRIVKSQGQTPMEMLLSDLCDRTFLKLWSYANPFKYDGKELCDLLAIFENHVFIFFDRESRKFDDPEKDVLLQWERWKKEVIQKQADTANGAHRYILENPGRVFLDQKATIPFPIPIPKDDIFVHKIVVAHGAKDACKAFSKDNVFGSLAVSYSYDSPSGTPFPFMVHLDKSAPVHIFDSHNLEIILNELDTFYDFSAYILAKEQAINQYDTLSYCGEEDLLAHYLANFDELDKKYFIGTKDKNVNAVFIEEGWWKDFIESDQYKLRNEVNKISYLWDEMLQVTCQNALDGSLLGDGDVFNYQSAIYEMAKEPRLFRRALSEAIIRAIDNFPENLPSISRNLSFMPSFYKDKGYIFLQLWHPNITDYNNEYRLKRQKILEISCGAAKNEFPNLKKIIGIAVDAPKLSKRNSEDFILFDCEQWSDEQSAYYEEANSGFQFFKSETLRKEIKTVSDFPRLGNLSSSR